MNFNTFKYSDDLALICWNKFGFAFPLLCYDAFLCIWKFCTLKTLLLHCLKHLVRSQAFTSVSYVRHHVTGVP